MKLNPNLSLKQSLSKLSRPVLLSCLCCSILVEVYAKDTEDYVFDDNMFRGSNVYQKKLQKLTQNNGVLAGQYQVEIYVNQRFVEKNTVNFVEQDNEIFACFSQEQLNKLSIMTQPNAALLPEGCNSLQALVGAGEVEFDVSKLRLDLLIPQTFMRQTPRGYVSPDEWQRGNTMAFLNYSANAYHNEQKLDDRNQSHDSAYVSLNGGFNMGAWQFRQQSNLSQQDGQHDFNIIRSYLKRPISQIKSELSLGELNSHGQFFSGLNYRGLSLNSDERMLPDSQRGYAPVIQGVAQTMARVSIQQNGREIYQTTVAPGAFKITDLFPTNYNGDLEVFVYESNGQQSSFKVPFSAVPESVRAGAFKYNVDLGETRDLENNAFFGNVTAQYGLSNSMTVNGGLRMAEDYQAAIFGGVLTNRFGAFGLDMTYSNAEIDQDTVDGWMMGLRYNKSLTNNTNFALASYHYSTEGYRDLSDVLNSRGSGVSENANNNDAFISQRSRMTATVAHNMGQYGALNFSGSAQNYYNQADDDYQLQLGYSKGFKNGINLNLNLNRQIYANNSNRDGNNDAETTFGLSLNIPSSQRVKAIPDMSLAYQHSPDNQSYQVGFSNNIDQANTMHYSVATQYDQNNHDYSVSGNLQKRFSKANTSVSAAYSDDSWQVAGSVQGALALHSGGVTFGPYLGETFALIEAPGAEGAKISNINHTRIDRRGYALVPALTPYRYNTISLNPEDMTADVDLEMGEQKIVPYSGASVKVKFKTKQGQALLIQSPLLDGGNLPLGADVYDENNHVVAVVGQNSQIYLRSEQPQAVINVVWGEEKDERCQIRYDINQSERLSHLYKINTTCQ
jgi:outer membrane usher protein